MSRERAIAIWNAAVDAVRPEPLVRRAVEAERWLLSAPRVLIVGAGKAGPGMAAGLTDHVWTFRELLTAKFEPVHNQSSSG